MKFNLKTPEFWRKKNSIISCILWPISNIYHLASQLRYCMQTPKKVKPTVICIGNATVGGSGKTPTAIALGKLLKQHKYKIAFACKNYNAILKHPAKVTKQNAKKVMEEAVLLSEIAPTYVAANRFDAIKLAEKASPNIIIVDDGLQNNSFHKDISILVIDQALELTNQFLFPAGPFRESIKNSIKKSDVILNINPKKKIPISKTQINTKTTFKLPKNTSKQYIAFTGIAFPEKFFNALSKLGIKMYKKISFPDHHDYKDLELENLIKQSATEKAVLITTTKDFVKIPSKYKKKIDTLTMELEILDKDLLLQMIQKNAQNI